MANKFEPGFGYDIELTYTKADGSPGMIDLSKPLEVILSTPAIAAVRMTPFDAATGKLTISIDHNGGVGAFTASLTADGNLSAADEDFHPVVWSDEFEAQPPLGSTGVSAAVSARRATPAPEPEPPVTP